MPYLLALSLVPGLDGEAFNADVAKAQATLACVNEFIPPEVAARVLHIDGIAQGVAGQHSAQIASFAAATDADPKYRFPPDLFGANNPAAVDYLHAMVMEPTLQPVDVPPPVVAKADPQTARVPTERVKTVTPPKPKPDRTKVMRIGLIVEGGGLLAEAAVAGLGASRLSKAFDETYHSGDPIVGTDNGTVTDEQREVFENRVSKSIGLIHQVEGVGIGLGVLGATALTLGLAVKW